MVYKYLVLIFIPFLLFIVYKTEHYQDLEYYYKDLALQTELNYERYINFEKRYEPLTSVGYQIDFTGQTCAGNCKPCEIKGNPINAEPTSTSINFMGKEKIATWTIYTFECN